MTSGLPQSPLIESQRWGVIEIAGGRRFKDAKLWPGGAREWDWRETGTHHVPGIQVADLEELLDRGAEALVLSRGMWQWLRVSKETLDWLDARGIEYHIAQTDNAVALYNELAGSIPMGGLLRGGAKMRRGRPAMPGSESVAVVGPAS